MYFRPLFSGASRLLRSPVLASSLILAAAYPIASSAEPVRGGTITIAIDKDTPSLLASNNTTAATQSISPKIFDGLLTYSENFEPSGQLAKEWNVSPDGLEYTFKLRDNASWHDGKPLTSADVAFSINRLKEGHPRGRVTFAAVKSVETPDAHTVVLRLSTPAPFLLTALAASESPIIPAHIFADLPAQHVPTPKQLIGTGPFRISEVQIGSHVTLTRNEAYWDKGKPYLDRIVYRVLTDANARAAALETGEVDLGENIVPLADTERLAALDKVDVLASNDAYAGSQRQLVFNLDNPQLADVRVRQAIALAIDLQKIVDLTLSGYGKVSPSPITVNLTRYYDPSIKPRTVDLNKANALLDEAGKARGANGTRFALKIRYNAAADNRTAEYIKQALAPLGIAIDIAASDGPTYIKSVYTDRDFGLTVESLANVFDPTVGVQRVYWSKNFKIGLPFSNGAHYANERVDALLEQAAIEPNEEKRKALFSEFQQIIDRDLPVLNLYAPQTIVTHNTRVRDFANGAHGLRHNFAATYVVP